MIHRRWVAWLLCCMFLFNYLGYWITVALVQQQMKSDALERLSASLPETAFTLINIPLSHSEDINEAKSGELTIGGNMFDVVKTRTAGSLLVCYCLNDAEEESLIKNTSAHIDTQISVQGKTNTEHSRVFKQSIIDNFILPPTAEGSIPGRLHQYGRPMNLIYQSVMYRLIVPPPKSV